MKKHLLFWKLTRDQCRTFSTQPSFRSQLESLVHDPSQQLCLRFVRAGIAEVNALDSVHMLELRYCHGITDVSALGGVHTLTLYFCHGIIDVSALGSVHTLTLQFCEGITDVSALGSVHTLKLFSCRGISDSNMSALSTLGSVHALTLIPAVKDDDDV
jgi:hypothetical protein